MLSPHPTPINSNNLPTDIGTGLARQPNNGALEILGITPPPHGNSLQDLPGTSLIIDERLVHIGPDVARRDGIDVDPLARPLVAEGLGQLRDAALGAGVRRHRQPALEGHEAGDVDDRAAMRAGALEHVRPKIPTQREHRAQVHLQHLAPVAERELVRGMPTLDPRAGHQDRHVVPVA